MPAISEQQQQIPATGLPGVDWESCMTMNDHWGYNKNDKNFKLTEEILRMLADIASRGDTGFNAVLLQLILRQEFGA